MAAAEGRPTLRGYRLIGREIGFNQSCVPSELYARLAELINSNTSAVRLLPLVSLWPALICPFVTLICPADNAPRDHSYFSGKEPGKNQKRERERTEFGIRPCV